MKEAIACAVGKTPLAHAYWTMLADTQLSNDDQAIALELVRLCILYGPPIPHLNNVEDFLKLMAKVSQRHICDSGMPQGSRDLVSYRIMTLLAYALIPAWYPQCKHSQRLLYSALYQKYSVVTVPAIVRNTRDFNFVPALAKFIVESRENPSPDHQRQSS